MRRIAIINQKGGVGKTTTTANLGAALAIQGRRVVVVDMDAQANLSLALGVEVPSGEPTSYSVLLGEQPFGACLRPTKVPGLQLLASNIDLSGAEMELASAMGREYLLRDALREWDAKHRAETGRSGADYVLFDCPPSLGLLSINALAAAGEVLITLQTEFLALQGMSKLVEVVQLLKRRLNPELVITGIVPTLYDSRLKLAREVLGEIRTYFKGQVVPHPVRANVKLAETPSFAQTIFEYAPDSNGAYDYMMLAKELLTRESRDSDLATLPPFDEKAALPLPPSAEPTKRVPPPPQRGPRKPKPEAAATSSAPEAATRAPAEPHVAAGKPGETRAETTHEEHVIRAPRDAVQERDDARAATTATTAPKSAPKVDAAVPRVASPNAKAPRGTSPRHETPPPSAVAERPPAHDTLVPRPPPKTPVPVAPTPTETPAAPSKSHAPTTTTPASAKSTPVKSTARPMTSDERTIDAQRATPAPPAKGKKANASASPAAVEPKQGGAAPETRTAKSEPEKPVASPKPVKTRGGSARPAQADAGAAPKESVESAPPPSAKIATPARAATPAHAPTHASATSRRADEPRIVRAHELPPLPPDAFEILSTPLDP